MPGLVRLATLTLAVGLLTACARAPGARGLDDEQLETVEVDAGVTARLTPDGDSVAAPAAPELAGALPPDYPGDLPVPLPSSVVDFGSVDGVDEVDGAQRFVLVASPLPAAEVEAQLIRALKTSSWRAVPGAGPLRRQQAGRFASYRLEAAGREGTRVRIEYPARRESRPAPPG